MSEARDRDTRRQLEEERDFLLQSLDDLEVEHDSGGIDDESYAELHDDYTARAAAVIRTLRDGVDARPEPPRSERTTRRRVVVVAGIVVFALVVGVLLSSALGVRLPGQTSSGNTGASPSTTNASQRALATKITDLEAKVNATPDDYLLRMQLARAYEENSDLSNALKQSDAAITVDPNRPEGHALKDYSRSQVDLQNYLIKAPTGQWATQARQLLAQVTTALESPSTTVPPTTTQPTKK